LNGDNYSGDLPLTAFDDGSFYLNVPLSLDPGESTGVIELFSMTAPAYGLGTNFYGGSYEIVGGSDSTSSDLLASENFDIQVRHAGAIEPGADADRSGRACGNASPPDSLAVTANAYKCNPKEVSC
jgi:hypothetical protein